MEKRTPPPGRVIAYAAASLAAAVGLYVLFMWLRVEPTPTALNLNAGSQATSPERDRFNERYQLGWRSDGGAGNTGAEAVALYPALVEALIALPERSVLQEQLAQSVTRYPVDNRVAFFVTLVNNEPFANDFRPETHLQLSTDRGQAVLERWQTLDSGSPNEIAGVVWFVTAGTPDRLTLAMNDLPGTTRPATMSWNATAFRSVPSDATQPTGR